MSVVFPVSYTDRQTKCTKGSNPQPLPERDLGATLGNSVEDGRQRQRRAGLSGIFFFVCFLFSARPPSPGKRVVEGCGAVTELAGRTCPSGLPHIAGGWPL